MRITVLAQTLRHAGGLVVGTRVIESLLRLRPPEQLHFIVPDLPEYTDLLATAPAAGVDLVGPQGWRDRLFYDYRTLPRQVRDSGCDVLLSLTNFGLNAPPCPQVVLLHQPKMAYDRSHYGRLGAVDQIRQHYLKLAFRRQLARTATLLVQTPVMVARIRQRFDFEGDIVVCGSGGSVQRAPEAAGPMPAGFAPHADHLRLLYPARYYPHKNHELLVDAVAAHPDALSGVTIYTTIAADQHAGARALLRRIERDCDPELLVNLGPIPNASMADHYQHCDGVLMPTLLESFGLPFVEAIAMRRPVLASDIDFAREACGEAALYFDPWSTESLVAAIGRFRDEPALRERLLQAGRERSVEIPDWDTVTRTMLDAVERLASATAEHQHDAGAGTP